MKIFFAPKYRTAVTAFFALIFLASCTKNKPQNNGASAPSMADKFLSSQASQKSSAKTPLERIRFNKGKAVKDFVSVTFNDCTAKDTVRNMKAGWNLGNTFDATGNGNSLESEISWGQPYTTRAMIDGLAASGIKTIRIPVSWSHHIIDTNYTIDPAWMSRVKEVVDWAIEDGLYVIINIHHDNYDKTDKMPPFAGFYPSAENFENSADFVCNVWAQISLAFNNGYDEHLIFEALNEPRLCGTAEEWWYNPASKKSVEAMQSLNKLNQAILDVIRASDGNNKKRMLAFASLQASPDSAMAGTFKMPQDYDYKTDRLILSVHMYTPYNFAMESPGISDYTALVKKEFVSVFKRLNESYIEKGYAVYVGEYGATNKNNLEDRVAWFGDFIKESRAYGMSCILWDNGVWKVEGNEFSEHYGFYNRENQSWYFPEIIEAINSEIK